MPTKGETAEPAGKRRMVEQGTIMDTEAGFALHAPEEHGSSSRNDTGFVAQEIQQPEPPTVQSRDTDALMSDDEFGLESDYEDDLSEALAKVELNEANMKKLAEERLRIAIPSKDSDTWRVLSPSQFEKETGKLPSKADYDANCLLIRHRDGSLMTKPKYYDSIRARFNSGKAEVDLSAARQEFNKEMDELGVSHNTFGANRPAGRDETVYMTPDGARDQKRVPEHPRQFGQALGNVIIPQKDGTQTISYRSTDPTLAKSNLSQLVQKHGPDNVELRVDDGIYRTKGVIERNKDPNYPLAYSADQLYKSFGKSRAPATKAYILSGEGHWTDKAEQDPRTRADNYAKRNQDKALVVNPTTKALLSPNGVSYLVGKNKSSGKTTAQTMREAGLDPNSTDMKYSPPSDVLVQTRHGVLAAGEKLQASAKRRPLTQQYLKSEINLQNYRVENDRRVATGNYSTLETRERTIQRLYSKEPPAQQYARLYGSLEQSQRDQLNMPAPAPEYARDATPPSTRVDRSRSNLPTGRTPSQTPGPDLVINSIEPTPNSDRSMSRPPRSPSYGI